MVHADHRAARDIAAAQAEENHVPEYQPRQGNRL